MPGFSDLWYWINARFLDKYWQVDTKLNRNHYHEVDTRLLYACFSLLENFVEVELKHFQRKCLEKDGDGVTYLMQHQYEVYDTGMLWEGATDTDVKEVFGEKAYTPTEMSKARKELLDLYHWWKLREHTRSHQKFDHTMWDKWEQEDTEQLIRLIKARGAMWT